MGITVTLRSYPGQVVSRHPCYSFFIFITLYFSSLIDVLMYDVFEATV